MMKNKDVNEINSIDFRELSMLVGQFIDSDDELKPIITAIAIKDIIESM